MPSDGRCDRCEEQRETTRLIRQGRTWAVLCQECHDVIAEEIADPTIDVDGAGEPPREQMDTTAWKLGRGPL